MSNFDFLKKEPEFKAFADVAISAEKILYIDKDACVLNCRRAMEFAIKWMYSIDDYLEYIYQDNLINLMSSEDFRDIVGEDIWRRLDYIRRVGNQAAHNQNKITIEKAKLAIENLYYFMDFIACCYGSNYEEGRFDKNLLEPQEKTQVDTVASKIEIDLKQLMKENAALKEELTKRREKQQQHYVVKPMELSEFQTRKIYIDTMLEDAGWEEGRNWINEVELKGMPNKSKVGYADYVLYDDAHNVLAVIEAKRTCKDVAIGRQQAKLYADLLEKQYGRRPVIFLTNGFETRIDDGQYPERKVATIYSKRDLEKWFNLRAMRRSLNAISIDKNIAGRYYQEGAVKAVCDAFDKRNRRKALLVMATGSGKTRTVISLCDVLLQKGWIKNILFLADRNALVTQAKRSFVNLLPNLSVTNLCEEKDNYKAHCVFSTYQTMMGCIDEIEDKEGKLFTCGHFDLVICDEAHRSIYNKYRDIFNYFDAPLVGLTATPKDEIDKNTYNVFELENGVPTYGYELGQAVRDGYLVDFSTIETSVKFLEEGIVYDDLSEEEKADYEEKFAQDGNIPDRISSSALNNWLFNEDTIKKVLDILMREGIHVDYGEKLGKTIIFAKNHEHAERIYKIFNKEYPEYNGYAKVIDNYTNYAQSLIDEFSEPDKLPQIAISVDMLDTGIDVPEILNLVFFKKVMSKAKFWQMIGRGTRLCPGVLDGHDKEKFYIFDFCGNFEFFRMNEKGKPASNMIPLQGAIFAYEFEIATKLQDINFQTDRLMEYRKFLVEDMSTKVNQLNRDNFAVRQHLKHVDTYSKEENYVGLTFEDTLVVRDELAPLILPDKDEINAVRFDALMLGMELAFLEGGKYGRRRSDLFAKVEGLNSVADIPEVKRKKELINKILHTDYVDTAGIDEFEHIRKGLRDLIKFIPKGGSKYYTDYADRILGMDVHESGVEEMGLQTIDQEQYKARAEYYVRQHQDNIVIAKLKNNKPMTQTDLDSLENMLWSEVGTKDEYNNEYGSKPLGEFVREIVGLDMNAAKEAFAEFLDETTLDSRQIYFVNQIVEYVVHNGMMKDLSVMQETPFTDRGSIIELFEDLEVWNGIRKVIDEINQNADIA